MITCFEHHSFPLRVTQVIGSNRFDAQETVSEKVKAETPKPAWSRGCDDEVTVQSIQECHPNLTETFLQQQPDGHIIFFWASTTFLDVQRPRDLTQDPTAISYTARDRGIVRNRKGEPVGTVDTMGPSHWNQTPDPSGLQEFVAVGRRAVAEIPDLPAVVLALQIRWENGLASRVNIAEIEETAWIAAEPAWKLIALR
jgi:hypothetical protein